MITVYSKESCAKCKQAEILLMMKGVTYDIKKLDVDYDLEFVKSLAPLQRGFPVITKDGVLIGGLTELKVSLS